MNTSNVLKHIDGVYTKIKKKLITNKPLEKPSLDTIKNFTQKNIEKIKSVGIKETFLTLGTPEEKTVLYKEVIKREKQEEKELAKREREARKAQKELEKESKSRSKKSTSKTNQTKTKAEKKVSTKNAVETKSATKKTTTKKPTEKKTTNTIKKTTSSTKKSVDKKEATKKTTVKKKTPTTKKTVSTTKSTTTPKVSKRDEKIALYIKDIKKHYGEVDDAFVAIIVKNLGPSIYRKNAELVSCSDPKELDTVRRNFLMKKLGIDASQGVLDAAIQDVCTELKGVRTKYRATFYYALAKKFKKESVLS